LRIAGKRFSIQPSTLGFRVNVDATAKKVLAAGREPALHRRWYGYFRRTFSPLDVPLEVAFDTSAVERELSSRAAEAIPDPPFSGGIRVEGTSANALPPRAGRTLARPFDRAVLAALLAPEGHELEPALITVPASLPATAADQAAANASALLKAPVSLRSREPAAELSLGAAELGPVLQTERDGERLRLTFDQTKLLPLFEATRKKLEHEPVDAKFEVDAQGVITITPSETGLRLDVARLGEALLAAAAGAERSADLPLLHEPKPALDGERAAGLGIRGLVSSFTTRHPCCERRVANIHRIADLLNGRVIEPGQTVSINELVGPRTLKAGFVPAPTIEEGEMVDSIGGGISQFATTFFNALFHGGYDIIERQPHSYWFPRYPMGHEATLSWPKPDIIFKNDTAAGLLIKTSYTDTSITVKLYGDNGGRKVRAEVSGRQNILPAPVEILPNPAVPPDEEKVKEPGSIGWSVIVSRILTFPDGTKKEERRRVTYKVRPKRVEVHPCRIPKGEKGYTGETCPEPENVEELEPAAP
ncbi:MAG TPA: VanW family protein, partial [Polyangiaceae bacterium]